MTTGLVKAGCVALVVLNVLLLAETPCSNPTSLEVETSWIGNTFGGARDKWVGMDARGMYVTPDGTVYTNAFWEEGGKEAGIYKNGDVLGQLEATHGWGRMGGYAVTANSKYVYATMRQDDEVSPEAGYPPKGTTWYGVRRYNRDGTSAPFATGDGYDSSMLIVESLTHGTADVRGVAADEDRLYVSDDYNGEIKVYDAETMVPIAGWPVNRPRQLAVDDDGSLWVVQGAGETGASRILHYSRDGTRLHQRITDVSKPAALALDGEGRLLVADNGPEQRVKIYDVLEEGAPKVVGYLGKRGGLFGGTPGKVEPLKFNGLIGVGGDAEGNLYVGYNGVGPNRDPEKTGTGLVLQSYSADQALEWELLGLQFVDNADADPASDGRDVYTKDEHFEMDFGEPSGRQWSYVGHTVDRFRYPEDPRLNLGETQASAPLFRRIGGEPFLFVTDMYSHFLQVYRFDPETAGEVAIPSGLFARAHQDGAWPPHQPAEGEWIWRDGDGDGAFGPTEYEVPGRGDTPEESWGWWVDDAGDVWQAGQGSAGIRHFPLQGLDRHGNPIYTHASMRSFPVPEPFSVRDGGLQRIEYDSKNDVMYLAGYTAEHPFSAWGQVGKVVARYDEWSRGNRAPRWQSVLAYEDTTEPVGEWPKAMSVAGDKLFVAYLKTAEVHIYDTETGDRQGIMGPGPNVGSDSGWIDIPYGVRAYRRSDGEYLIFAEEDAFAKVIMYSLDGDRSQEAAAGGWTMLECFGCLS